MSEKYVSFHIGDSSYAIPLEKVLRIVRFEGITEVPKAPQFVRGVLNLQGDVIPVINLRERFGLPEAETNARRRIIIIHIEKRSYGLLVDGVREIVEIDESKVERDATSVFGRRAEFTVGIAKLEKGLLIILDLLSIMSSP